MESYRKRLTAYIASQYGAEPEVLWADSPNYWVFRHGDNRKWFALVMDVRPDVMGLCGTGTVDILNLKLSDPLFAEFLSQQPGYRMAYHFARGSWVSILLDGTVPFEEVVERLDESYAVTAKKPKRKAAKTEESL